MDLVMDGRLRRNGIYVRVQRGRGIEVDPDHQDIDSFEQES